MKVRFVLIWVLVMAISAKAQDARVLPSTPAGQFARQWLEMFNSGDRAQFEKFQDTQTTGALASQRDLALRVIGKAFQESGGFDISRIIADSEHNAIFEVQTRRGKHGGVVRLVVDGSNPVKLADFDILPLPSQEKYAWPKGKLDEATLSEAIGQYLAKLASADRFSGTVVVAKRDHILFQHAYGFANAGFQIPNDVHTKYNLGSMDKMYVAVSIGQLAQQGKLAFSDTLAKVLPEYRNRAAAHKITIDQLLTHRSGIPEYMFIPKYRAAREKYVTPSDFMSLFEDLPLDFEPGSRWSYSNSNFIVLGAVIEKLTGESCEQYIRDHVYAPAGMTESGWFALDDVVPNLAQGYMRYQDRDPLGLEPRQSNVMFAQFRGNPSGGGYSSALDLYRFARALRTGKLVSPAMVETLTASKTDTPMPALKFAYGFSDERAHNGKELRGYHGGGPNSGINSAMLILWDADVTVAVGGNYDAPNASSAAREIANFLATQY